MDLTVASLRIARDIAQAEEALNDALIAQSDLYANLLKVRKEAGTGSFTGHEQLLRLMKVQQDLLSSSGNLARVHSGLLDVQIEHSGITRCPENGEFMPIEFDRDIAA